MSASQAPPFTFPSTPASNTLTADNPNPNPDRTPSPQHSAISARHQQMKRFARSADKRQSVHMLGSIQHLQRHFMKFGVADNQDAPQPRSRLGSNPAQASSIEEDASEDPSNVHIMPLAPATVAKPPYPLFETPKVTLGTLRTDAFAALRRMEAVWRIGDGVREGEEEPRGVRVLEMLRTTVDAVRAVRAWSLAVPAALLAGGRGYGVAAAGGIGKGKPSMTMSTPSRPAVVGRTVSGSAGGVVAGKVEEEGERDPLVELRRRALDVLVALRGLEERFRVEEKGEASVAVQGEDDPPEALAADTHVATPERSSDPEIDDPDAENLWLFSERFGDTPGGGISEEKTSWYERLATGEEGWAYRDDVTVGQVRAEREAVEAYLEAVERTFGEMEGGRPWRLARSKEKGEDEDDVFRVKESAEGTSPKSNTPVTEVRPLPDWAVAERWQDMPDQRILAFLRAHVPSRLSTFLPSADADDSESSLLNRISDGYLLIIAFNTALSHAAGSWGFIPDEDVHDTMAVNGQDGTGEEDSGRRPRDWTFRRAGNLRSWGAALKKRYNLPLLFPVQAVDLKPTLPLTSTNSSAASRQVSPSRRPSSGVPGEGGEGIHFDPVAIARREEGWDGTLRRVAVMWIDRVVGEMA